MVFLLVETNSRCAHLRLKAHPLYASPFKPKLMLNR